MLGVWAGRHARTGKTKFEITQVVVLNRPDSHPGEVPSRHTTLFGHDDDDDDVELNAVRLGCRVDILGTNCDQRVCMVQCCFTSTKTIRLIRTESSSELTLFGHRLVTFNH